MQIDEVQQIETRYKVIDEQVVRRAKDGKVMYMLQVHFPDLHQMMTVYSDFPAADVGALHLSIYKGTLGIRAVRKDDPSLQ